MKDREVNTSFLYFLLTNEIIHYSLRYRILRKFAVRFPIAPWYHGTLPWNIDGSSSFCKGSRTSKVWKSKDLQGPRTLRICMPKDLCKNYYSHLYFTVVTFLTKIQNWCYITKKNLSKHNCQKSWMVKTTTVQKFGWEKPLSSK